MKPSFSSRLAGLCCGALLALGISSIDASAVTVAAAGTGSSGTGGFTLTGGSGVITDVAAHSAYNNSATTPASNWVWDTANTTGFPITFSYQFDMTGFDVLSAALSGIWQVDNAGTARLNGTTLATLASVGASYSNLNPLIAGSSAFVSGINTVTFEVVDLGLPGAFRSSFTVTADAMSVVPLPAGAPLLLTGLIGLVALRRRKKANPDLV